ncbi:metal ABC transporter permease [Oceanicella actignis]|uniref:High-affinity zinc uptake system membrane protein ZnuB n=1 Tax=Oceanicella actignis TaxID=1189325 RepID=A0A1M7S0K5_9RHOB|nr:metal ABC transporter permease [Oceanicella actignis]TYO90090.1 zinc transport system permease protein [Oceanicella actignis]SES93686.1 zinc transport system permease protein [Oceanicella actignis]SHN51960.1 zinc transport system permease protein [Oceanicella actignis]
MSFLDDFMARAALAGIGLSLAAGPLGCLVVWRRMAYFGDAVSHAAVLGVALSLLSGAAPMAGVLVMALLMAALVAAGPERLLAMDAMLGVASHAALALGLVAVTLLEGVRVDLMGYLFGDILAVSRADLVAIWAASALAAAVLAARWRRMLLATLSEDLAAAEGVSPRVEKWWLALALALLTAAAIKVVGALLITALLIMPAAAARTLARSPETMALGAAAAGVAATLGGLRASWLWDAPAGPAVVTTAAAILALLGAARALLGRRAG